MEAKEAPETGSRSHDLVFQKLITNNHSAMLCLVTQSCPTICDPMDGRPLGSSVHGESLGKNTGVGCHPLLQGDLPNSGFESRSPVLQVDTLFSEPPEKLKNTGVGSLSLLQGIFLTQESNWGLLNFRWIHYQLNYWGSPTTTVQFSSVAQSCLTLCTGACQASQSITNFWSLLKFMPIESVMPSNHHPLSSPSPPAFNLFPASGAFQMS